MGEKQESSTAIDRYFKQEQGRTCSKERRPRREEKTLRMSFRPTYAQDHYGVRLESVRPLGRLCRASHFFSFTTPFWGFFWPLLPRQDVQIYRSVHQPSGLPPVSITHKPNRATKAALLEVFLVTSSGPEVPFFSPILGDVLNASKD